MITTLTSIVNTLVATGVVDFPANYKITNKDHVFVYYVDGEEAEVLLVQVTAFTAGTPNEYKVNAITESGFNVELRDAYDTSDGRKISTRRVLPLTQEVDYPPGNDFPAATHERALDKLTAIVQQFSEQLERQIGMPLSEDSTETNLPAFIPNAYLGLDGDNDFVWKSGTGAPENDEIKASHIDWGTGVDQVKASDMPIEDVGSIITATEVEGALQENRIAMDLNTTHRTSDGKNHSDVVLNNTHRVADGKDHSDVVLNNTHRTSDGSDHSFIDQDVKTTAGPTFSGGVDTGGTLLKEKLVSGSASSLSILIAHGLDQTKIRGIRGSLTHSSNYVTGIAVVDATNIRLNFASSFTGTVYAIISYIP